MDSRAGGWSWSLRAAEPSDVPFLVRLHRATMREYVEAIWGWDDADQALRHTSRVSTRPDDGDRWIISVDGVQIGMLEVWQREHDTYIGAIEIDPKWQSRGIGRSVLGWLREEAAKRGDAVRLRVLRSNPRACRFYEREGFTRIADGEFHFEYTSPAPGNTDL